MSRSFLPACALLLSPMLLGLTSCDTVYSRTYAYEKTHFRVSKQTDGKYSVQKGYTFEPYEQQALARFETDKQNRDVERMRVAAQRSEKMNADKSVAGAASLKLDSGLGETSSAPMGGASSGSIPGLDSGAGSMSGSSSLGLPGMSAGSIPGLDSPAAASSMAPASSSMAPSMSGAMDGSMAPSMGAAPAGAPAAPGAAGAPKPASTMLPGL